MRAIVAASLVGVALALSASGASAQFGGGVGGGGGLSGTGDAAAQNLPSTVGIGNQTGNGYYGGPGGGEIPYTGPYARPSYNGRTIYRAPVPPGYPSYPY